MHKVKSVLLDRNRGSSPSPDSRRAHLNQPTSSPAQEIEKFLAIGRHQVKIKKQGSLKATPSLSASSKLSSQRE